MKVSLRGRGLRQGFEYRIGRARRQLVDVSAKARAKLRTPGVVTAVSPREDMLTGGNDLRLYFEVGESALQQIQIGLEAAGADAPRRILDLPAGFGRVLRYLRAAWPDAEITAMELVPEARFCAKAFGARPVVSRQPLWLVTDAGDQYDLLWCGSLLTHFNEDEWVPVLSYFRDRLAVGGTLIFTTHGDLSIDLLAGLPYAVAKLGPWIGDYGIGSKATAMVVMAHSAGFAFSPYGDDTGPFGLSISSPDWVRKKTEEVTGLEFVLHVPHGWFEHQDVWTYRRVS